MTYKLSRLSAALVAASALTLTSGFAVAANKADSKRANDGKHFVRIATLPVCTQIDAACDTDTETAAEISAVSHDGRTVIYTDSPQQQIGFVDITHPASPAPMGVLPLSGEPTSVAVNGRYALVGVNTSADYVNVSGHLAIVDIASQAIVHSIDLGGQPDSVAVSPDGNYAAIAIENERDEDLGDGVPPQMPAGFLVVVDTSSVNPAHWTTTKVEMTGIADLYSDDPEPEYVDINSENIAVLSMQENNHLVLVDLPSASVIGDFSAGSLDLEQIDATEEDPAIISLTESQLAVLREPDGLTWIGDDYFVTADEGDLDGGSRSFTVFNKMGDVVFSSGNSLDYLAVRFGQYPDGRSGNKGNEPENAEFARFGNDNLLFVNSERASLVFVYDVTDPTQPRYLQTLPTALGPEGVVAVPSRRLLIVSSEEDNRDDKFRGGLNIYQYKPGLPTFPTIASVDQADGTPIAWSALSGLAASADAPYTLWSIEDSFYGSSRIFKLDISDQPAKLTEALTIRDSNDMFAEMPVSGGDDALSFTAGDLAAMINADKSVNLDPEGIAVASDSGFWLASEGNGTIGDAGRPINSLNLLFKLSASAEIEQVITLPDEINAKQVRFGFEGVAEQDGVVYVAFQRAWKGESNPRIGAYDLASQTWTFFFYPLDAVESQAGGWVGLSDITAIGNGELLVLERDNQGGPDAAIKRIYKIAVADATAGSTLGKTLVRDLMAEGDLTATGGLVPEKLEGMAVTADGDLYIVNDNDGVDDNSGETRLINLGPVIN